VPTDPKNPGRVEFSARIQGHEKGGAYVEFPHDVESLYGLKGRVPVRATFDGLAYRGSMVKMGTPHHILLILKEIRERLGKGPGDRIRVAVELDEAPCVIELLQGYVFHPPAGIRELDRGGQAGRDPGPARRQGRRGDQGPQEVISGRRDRCGASRRARRRAFRTGPASPPSPGRRSCGRRPGSSAGAGPRGWAASRRSIPAAGRG
jgi:Domain of unknown function (DUF1905)